MALVIVFSEAGGKQKEDTCKRFLKEKLHYNFETIVLAGGQTKGIMALALHLKNEWNLELTEINVWLWQSVHVRR